MGGNRWKHLIYADITGRRVRAFPLLREFGDAQAQHQAYNNAQRAVMRKHQLTVLIIVMLSLEPSHSTRSVYPQCRKQLRASFAVI